ncbi:hypothetical protein FHU10_2527 [Serratia fonticola]|uniref:Uncharacterized protein n=1 Tax=Serratia fonticola TaxID=47917 RepID=A0A542CXD9_SERFO|nr:HEPN domain-containing protein [Serratia fonticola]TQI82495.1 hypothetical protein FHU09_5182 [Serratia fonticola]TQI95486.1 hypothetical protein FHU11_0868 [Serratia fonticola]TVZ69981.1 hypothetical protein FHU10_2527 [Serratia fonticola]
MRVEGEYKKTGYFWLPGEDAKKIPGVLSINDGGEVELEIIGFFDTSINSLDADDNIDRIIGHVEVDGLVTLDDCSYSCKNFSFGGISKSKILVRRALVGADWGKDEDVTFNTFSFTLDCLDEWVGISGIDVRYDRIRKTAMINFNPPEIIEFTLDNEMKLSICFTYSLPSSRSLKEAKITQDAYFKLESDKLLALNDFKTVAYKITNLMCFAMDEVVTMKNVSATSSEIQHEVGAGKKYPVSIKIYYQSIPYSEKIPERDRYNMLFNFGTVKNNAQQVFNNWINAYEYLYPALGLYFSTKVGAQKYLDGKFLALAQGLETYHRRTSNEKLMELEDFESLVSKILEACPNEHIDWLKGRLMHGNEISLRNRLKKIIEPFEEHLGTSKERSKLLRKIVDTRNYFTHYSEDLEGDSAKGKELWNLCLKMEAILNLHFLNVIGFTVEEIKIIIENCAPLQRKLEGV